MTSQASIAKGLHGPDLIPRQAHRLPMLRTKPLNPISLDDVLSTLLQKAVEWGVIEHVPCASGYGRSHWVRLSSS
jgi:hypothetical protein